MKKFFDYIYERMVNESQLSIFIKSFLTFFILLSFIVGSSSEISIEEKLTIITVISGLFSLSITNISKSTKFDNYFSVNLKKFEETLDVKINEMTEDEFIEYCYNGLEKFKDESNDSYHWSEIRRMEHLIHEKIKNQKQWYIRY